MQVTDIPKVKIKCTITKYADDEAYKSGDAYEIVEVDTNLLTDNGATEAPTASGDNHVTK